LLRVGAFLQTLGPFLAALGMLIRTRGLLLGARVVRLRTWTVFWNRFAFVSGRFGVRFVGPVHRLNSIGAIIRFDCCFESLLRRIDSV